MTFLGIWRNGRSLFVGQINVVVINVPGSLGTITSAIGRSRSNIRNIDFLVREQDFFKMLIDVEVTDLKQFSGMIAGLRHYKRFNLLNGPIIDVQ